MVFKINVSYKGVTKKYEVNNEDFIGLKIGEKVDGKMVSSELEGYELEIKGTSDKAGFPGLPDIPGPFLKRVLLKKGRGMRDNTKGIRRRKTVRGNEISQDTVQINLSVIKEGKIKAEELFKKKEENKQEKQ
ncbi:MAG: S6e family ribosomal protein [Candidatus Pacearchaeota archaeon]